ncbi:MAG: aminopeptidase, partial [Proteobacteria bacterium]|nr:aminopeptidase [Pseudomonadota bacterium]
RVGEFAIGTNVALTKLIGNLLQDEKFPGVHVALGSPYPDKTGASWESKAHNDGVMRDPTVVVDGSTIMERGRFTI